MRQLALLAASFAVLGCADVLPEDKNPEREQCVERAAEGRERCYGWVKEGYEYKCDKYYQEDVNECLK